MRVSPSQDYMMKPGVVNKLKQARSPDRGNHQQDKGRTITWLRDKLKSTLDNNYRDNKTISKNQSKGKYELRHSAEQLDGLSEWKFIKLASPFIEDPVGVINSQEREDLSLQYTLFAFQEKFTKLFAQNALKQVAIELISGLLLSFLSEASLIGHDNTITLLKKILDIGGLYTGFDLRRKSSSSAKNIFIEKCLGKKMFEQSVSNFVENLLFGRTFINNKVSSNINSQENNTYTTESQRRTKKLMVEVLNEESFTSDTGSTDMRIQYNQNTSNQPSYGQDASQSPRKCLRHIQLHIQRPEIDQTVAYLEFIRCILDRMALPVTLWRVTMIDKARMLSSQEKIYENTNQLLFSNRLQILVTIDCTNSIYFRFGILQSKERAVQTAKATLNKYITLTKKYQGSVERKTVPGKQIKYLRSDHKTDKMPSGSHILGEESTQRSKGEIAVGNNVYERSKSSKNHSARGRETSILKDALTFNLRKLAIFENGDKDPKKPLIKESERTTYLIRDQNARKAIRDLYSQLLNSKNTKWIANFDRLTEIAIRDAEAAPASSRGANTKKHYVLDTGNAIEPRDSKHGEDSRMSDKINATRTLDSFLEKYKKKKNAPPSKLNRKQQAAPENRLSFDLPKMNPYLKKFDAEKVNLTIDPFEDDFSMPSQVNKYQAESLRVSPKPFYDKLTFQEQIRESTQQALAHYYGEKSRQLNENKADMEHQHIMQLSHTEDGIRGSELHRIRADNNNDLKEGSSIQHWAIKQKMNLAIGGFNQLLAEHTSRIMHSLVETEDEQEYLPIMTNASPESEFVPPLQNKLYLHRNSSSISKSQSELYKPLSSKKSMKSINQIVRELHGSSGTKDIEKNFSSFTFSNIGKQLSHVWGSSDLRYIDSAKNLPLTDHTVYPSSHIQTQVAGIPIPSLPQQLFTTTRMLNNSD